jgi:hypothetical protein
MTFAYYFLSLHLSPVDPRQKKIGLGFQVAAIAITATAFISGAVIVGTPAAERERKYDNRRVEDLQEISNEIRRIVLKDPWESKPDQMERDLPKNLEEVAAAATLHKLDLTDPVTGETYVYEVTGKSTFRLCATFSTERDRHHDIFWNHPKGRHPTPLTFFLC